MVDIDLLAMNHRSAGDLDLVRLLAKEGWQRAHLGDYHLQRQALSRFTLGALLVSEPIVEVLRREVRRLSPEVRVTSEQLRAALETDVLKRDVLEGDKADAARRQITRAAGRALRALRAKSGTGAGAAAEAGSEPALA